MSRIYLLLFVVLLWAASGPSAAHGSGRRHVTPAAVIRAKDGAVTVRCSHGLSKSWRGLELHAGDTLRVGTRGWASVSVEATGARYLVPSGSSIRIDNGRLTRISGPLPRRGFDLPSANGSNPDQEAPTEKPVSPAFP